MNLSTPTTTSDHHANRTVPLSPTLSNSFQNDTLSNSTVYNSALENSGASSYNSFNESANNNLRANISTDLDATLSGSDFSMLNVSLRDALRNNNAAATASTLLIQSESTDTNTSQEEVDPKSQLANKTIFKTDNPNLSIIEISNNSSKDQELENSVVLVESMPDNNSQKQWKSPSKSATSDNAAAENRRRKMETLKQKLNVEIAEASANETLRETSGAAAAVSNEDASQPQQETNGTSSTKREITVYDTLEQFEANLPSTVTLLDTPFGSKVYLVGTAHFSEESQDDVSYVIRNVRPDVVMVELCPSRIHILKLDEKTLLEEAKNFNLAKIRSIIQTHGYINGIFFIMLLQMSAQIAKDLGMAPGGEFRRAFEEVHKIPGCLLHLGDRPIRITLHRALRALSLWQTAKLVWRLTSSDSISIEEVEECKQRDLLEKLMQEMAGEFPAFSQVFVKERDIYLCHSLQCAAMGHTQQSNAPMPIRPLRVVGVVGIGHAQGIAEMWGRVDPRKIPIIMEIPPASRSTRICKYTLKYGLVALTLVGAFKLLRPRLTRFF